MISIQRAFRIIDNETSICGTETVVLGASVGRILAEDVLADTDLPPFDRSMMDGFAVIAEKTRAGAPMVVVGESAAGRGWDGKLKPNEAVRIMTGARLPAGADAVLRVELTRSDAAKTPETMTPTASVAKGTSIVRRGQEIRKGTRIFRAGEVIDDGMIAPLASFGYSRLRVGRSPRVGILGTGSEIVDISKRPGRDQIRNSNSSMLDVLCGRYGSAAAILPMVGDNVAAIHEAVSQVCKPATSPWSRAADVVILTGGVSVGKYDHTKDALHELGAEILFEKVRMKPGKPVVFARLGKTLIFGLPGNPVSAAVTFHLFVRRALRALQGASVFAHRTAAAAAGSDVRSASERDTFIPSRIEISGDGTLIAVPLKWQGSADLVGFARADSLIALKKGASARKGETVQVVLLRR